MSSIASRILPIVAVVLTFSMVFPSILAVSWLKLDDPPTEVAGDSLMTTAFSDGFETGTLAQWTLSPNGRWQATGSRHHSGAYAATVNGGGPPASSTITSTTMDVYGSDKRNVTFWWQLSGSSGSLGLNLSIYDTSWHYGVWSRGAADADNTWHQGVVDLRPYGAVTTLRIAFSFTSSFANEKGWVDDIAVARNHPSADLVDLLYGNDGTYLYLQETLAAAPDTNRYTYVVTLDKPTAGAVVPDFRAVYTKGVSNLQRWNVSQWENVVAIQVTPGASNLTFRIPLASLANPALLQDTDLYFANLFGVVPSPSPAYYANPPVTPPGVDHAPDQGAYHIPNNNVSEVPWVALPLLLAAVVAFVALASRRFGLWGGGRQG